jgi:hypothetical protein
MELVSLATYYYSSQTFLAWVFNHYFYDRVHWAFIGHPFYPYREPNPVSSNPLKRYEQTYEAWFERDNFSNHMTGSRSSLRRGVQENSTRLQQDDWSNRLQTVCEKIEVVFFYPFVYRVDIDSIPKSRLQRKNSALLASNEFLIEDLRESEFDILFWDYNEDDVINSLKAGLLAADEVLTLMESRCEP